MKKYIAIAAVITTLIVIGAFAYFGSAEPPATDKPITTVTSSSSTVTTKGTDENKDDEDESQTDTSKPDAAASVAQKNIPAYQQYSTTSFEAAARTTRVLFFYDAAHEPSVKLDATLKAQASELPKNIHVFKVPLAKEKTFAERLSVTEPGIVLKYDEKDVLSGIYIATGTPDMPTFMKALAISKN